MATRAVFSLKLSTGNPVSAVSGHTAILKRGWVTGPVTLPSGLDSSLPTSSRAAKQMVFSSARSSQGPGGRVEGQLNPDGGREGVRRVGTWEADRCCTLTLGEFHSSRLKGVLRVKRELTPDPHCHCNWPDR